MMHLKYSYRITWSEEDQEFVGLCAEFPSLSWLAQTEDAAFKGIRKLVEDVVQDMQKNGEPLPEPLSIKKFSGKLILRIPPELHRELTIQATEAHMSLNRHILSKLIR